MASTSPLTRELELPLREQLVATRRDLHHFAEPGWCEFRTAAKVARTLEMLGWEVRIGRQVVAEGSRMGVPPPEQLSTAFAWARAHGVDAEIADKVEGGFTGIVATLRTARPGPVVALRFDIDANLGGETKAPGHFPNIEGFASVNEGVHHNCGHDGHTAIGLGLARVLMEHQQDLIGEVRLIFQPAEEGLRGARAMVDAGVLAGVDYFIGCHLGVQAVENGFVIPGYRNILASSKIDVAFTGRNAHAAISPHEGRNALLAACVAVQNLLAMPRHGKGETRVNVGLMSAGESRNSIPARARFGAELRADTGEILAFVQSRAEAIIQGAADMQGVSVESEVVGGSCGASSDAELIDVIARAARQVDSVSKVGDVVDFKGSDDAAEMMAFIQRSGGKAVYFGLGTILKDVHHNPNFDFDEAVMVTGVDIMFRAIRLLVA